MRQISASDVSGTYPDTVYYSPGSGPAHGRYGEAASRSLATADSPLPFGAQDVDIGE